MSDDEENVSGSGAEDVGGEPTNPMQPQDLAAESSEALPMGDDFEELPESDSNVDDSPESLDESSQLLDAFKSLEADPLADELAGDEASSSHETPRDVPELDEEKPKKKRATRSRSSKTKKPRKPSGRKRTKKSKDELVETPREPADESAVTGAREAEFASMSEEVAAAPETRTESNPPEDRRAAESAVGAAEAAPVGADGSAFPFMNDGEHSLDDLVIDSADLTDTEFAAAETVAIEDAARAAVAEARASRTSNNARSEDSAAAHDSVEPVTDAHTDAPATPFAKRLLSRLSSAWASNTAAATASRFRRTIVRSVAVGVFAMAAGFGYGAAVKLFFGKKHADLNGNQIASSAPTNSNDADPATPVMKGAKQDEPASTKGDASKTDEKSPPSTPSTDPESVTEKPQAEPAVNDSQKSESASSTAESKGENSEPSTAKTTPVAPSNDEKADPATANPLSQSGDSKAHDAAPARSKGAGGFEMPPLKSAVQDPNHPLAKGRRALETGDFVAARRMAAGYLLREDGLSEQDRLLVPQAYALLADVMKREWTEAHSADRKPAAKEPAAESQGEKHGGGENEGEHLGGEKP